MCQVMPEHIREAFINEVYLSLFTLSEQGHLCFEPFQCVRWQDQILKSILLMSAECRSEVMDWAGALRDELISKGIIDPLFSYASLLHQANPYDMANSHQLPPNVFH